MVYAEDTLSWLEVLDSELRSVFDSISPKSRNLRSDAMSAAMDYSPANSLYKLSTIAEGYDVLIPEPVFADAERLAMSDPHREYWMVDAINGYRDRHYPTAA